jgi:hypothetical protein
MQRFHLNERDGLPPLLIEDSGGLLKQLWFPLCNLVRVDLKLLRSCGSGAIALQAASATFALKAGW